VQPRVAWRFTAAPSRGAATLACMRMELGGMLGFDVDWCKQRATIQTRDVQTSVKKV